MASSSQSIFVSLIESFSRSCFQATAFVAEARAATSMHALKRAPVAVTIYQNSPRPRNNPNRSRYTLSHLSLNRRKGYKRERVALAWCFRCTSVRESETGSKAKSSRLTNKQHGSHSAVWKIRYSACQYKLT
ncbi:unnamed protein product [Ixodes persulcatus]